MKAEIRMPRHLIEYSGDALITNLTGKIDQDIELKIKGSNHFSRYSAWNFNGLVWWNDELGFWRIEVWQYNNYVATYLADTLEELANEVDRIYGGGETSGMI
jgi:hypothetical protein